MSFEEDFPSLKDKVFNIKSFVEFDGSEGENSEGELSKFVLLKVVKNNCNDKAKSVTHEELREAIDSLMVDDEFVNFSLSLTARNSVLKKLKRRLGL